MSRADHKRIVSVLSSFSDKAQAVDDLLRWRT
jgi:hypothetical protein